MILVPMMRAASLVDRVSQRAYRRLAGAILRLAGLNVEGSPLWVSPRVYWDAPGSGMISLGDRCVVSHYVKVLTHDFSLDRVAERRYGISNQEWSFRAPVRIGAQAFVGLGVTILPGVSIGDGAIIGSGSVVTRDVAPDTVVAGNPARLICTTEELWERSASRFSTGTRRR